MQYTTTKEIEFGFEVNERVLAFKVLDAESKLELTVHCGNEIYAPLKEFYFGLGAATGGEHRPELLFTRNQKIKFIVTGNVQYSIDESNLK